MIDDIRDSRHGFSAADWIDGWFRECAEDPVGLFGIIDTGRKTFGLRGLDLEAFVQRVLLALTKAGARPVRGSRTHPSGWKPQPQYGDVSEEIVNNIIQEWRSMGQDPDAGGLWFATPEVYEQQRL